MMDINGLKENEIKRKRKRKEDWDWKEKILCHLNI